MNNTSEPKLNDFARSEIPWLKTVLIGAGAAVLTFLPIFLAGIFALVPMAIVMGIVIGMYCANLNDRNKAVHLGVCVASATVTSLLMPFVGNLLSGTLLTAPYEWELIPMMTAIDLLGYGTPSLITFAVMRSAQRRS